MNFFAALLVQLLGMLGVVADAQGDTDGTGGDIVLASGQVRDDTVVYRVFVYGLHDRNEITGAFPSGAYFNRDGVFRPDQQDGCDTYSYRHFYRQGNSLVEIRIPRLCLPEAANDSVELTLLKLDQHEPSYPVYHIVDTVTIPAPADRLSARKQ